VKKQKLSSRTNLTAPDEWPPDSSTDGVGLLGFAAPNDLGGIERQHAYCSDMNV
jgi:hypothetical protein